MASPPDQLTWHRPAVAPDVAFARDDETVAISYTAGPAPDLRIPGAVWFALRAEICAGDRGAFRRLTAAWTPWTPAAGGLAAEWDGHVHLRYGYLGSHHIKIPAPVWRQICAAVRTGAINHLTD
ncbi:hypothetical protein [Frankia sp. QA3]|uniref:hypothetical protein n=1 Tax=Frankia sp. QA3 TaxID=710111 RepID=UPI000269CDA1|nr:hypothetical protein [Frankia sp. QA3]EIV96572.1 hypothetical protein FraQA3DRAFT_6476 [Frankia sp. QA3]